MAFTENPELLSWMRAQQNAGLSAENIINTALTAGWSKSTLEKNYRAHSSFCKKRRSVS